MKEYPVKQPNEGSVNSGYVKNDKKIVIKKDCSLGLLEKQIAENLNGKELWGDLDLSVEDYESLKYRLRTVLANYEKNIRGLGKQYSNVITTYLVFLARYEYDRNFWGLVQEGLDVPMDPSKQADIGRIALETFARKGFRFDEIENATRKYVEPILFEAGLPPESCWNDLFYVLDAESDNTFDPQLFIDDLVESRSYQIRKPMKRFLERFNGDRAIDFLLGIHDAMQEVDQGLVSDSAYCKRYHIWKEQERDADRIRERKKRENQSRPYLRFDDGKKGLCMILPRFIVQDEWVETVRWEIQGDDGLITEQRLSVFGDEGRRYTETIGVSVRPSHRYTVKAFDADSPEEKVTAMITWEDIEGVPLNGVCLFNASGRRVGTTYLPVPYSIAVYAEGTNIEPLRQVDIEPQYYPNNSADYHVVAIKPLGNTASIEIHESGKNKTLSVRPKVELSFDTDRNKNKTLFSLPVESGLFCQIPEILVSVEEGIDTGGFELRIGKEMIPLTAEFEDGTASVALDGCALPVFDHYGYYSVRLYKQGSFIKQIEFCLTPFIKSDYTGVLSWPEWRDRESLERIVFEKKDRWQLEFEGVETHISDDKYIIECPPRLSILKGKLSSTETIGNMFSCRFALPLKPFEIELVEAETTESRLITGTVEHFGQKEFLENHQWIRLTCYGAYKNREYQIRLQNINGTEQKKIVKLSLSGSINIELSGFYDTLRTCPLPARFELSDESGEKTIPLLTISDMEQYKRVLFAREYLIVYAEDDVLDISVKRFGMDQREYCLERSKILSDGAQAFWFHDAPDGLYTITSGNQKEDFFDYESSVLLSDSTNTVFLNRKSQTPPMEGFSNWLRQLVTDIINPKNRSNLSKSLSYTMRNALAGFNRVQLFDEDYEYLIALAYFVEAKCSKQKKKEIRECMRAVSRHILDGKQRTQLVRILSRLHCSQSIFDTCFNEYGLLLGEVDRDHAREYAEIVEPFSSQIAIQTLMDADCPIQETLGKSGFRHLIGNDAIKELLQVPSETEPEIILKEQRRFLREERPNKVRVQLSKEISGEWEPIQNMVQDTWGRTTRGLRLRTDLKPDVGVYFGGIRFVDQYVNWYMRSHS